MEDSEKAESLQNDLLCGQGMSNMITPPPSGGLQSVMGVCTEAIRRGWIEGGNQGVGI